jgi:cytochrome oxidase assembly protein ShyY1
MGLISSTVALQASIDAQTGFTYINKIISGATSEGVPFVFIDEKYLLPEMVQTISDSGYVVTKKTDIMGTHTTYLISWSGLPTIEIY